MNQKLDLTKKLLPQDFSNKLLSESLKLWWFDHRIVDQGGLRLTKEGFKALKEAGIKSYRVNFENEIIAGQSKVKGRQNGV